MRVLVLPGDGIGTEVMQEALKVLDVVADKLNFKSKLDIRSGLLGGCAYDECGTPLPEKTVRMAEESDAILFGAAGGPKWEKLPPMLQPERGALLPLRKHFSLFANIRPVKLYESLVDNCPLKNEIVEKGVDIVFFRELTGGLYFSTPKFIAENRESATDTMTYSKLEIQKIGREAFKAAQKRKKHLTSVDKANVLMTSVLWRETIAELQKTEFPDVTVSNLYVDNASMQLVRDPSQFDVIVTENMFGDILSDESAIFAGSLGMLPSASINKNGFGLYEPIAGSAPDIAGKGVANPIAEILSVALMLRYSFDMENAAVVIEDAVEKTLEQGFRTKDIFKNKANEKLLSTEEMGNKIVESILLK